MKENTRKIGGEKKRPPLSKKARAFLIAGVALLLVAALTIGGFLLFRRDRAVFSYRGVDITEEMYHFWFSSLKTDYMVYYGLRSDSEATFRAACTLEGQENLTWGEFLTERIHEAMKAKLVGGVLFDRLGVTMSSSDRALIAEYLDSEIDYATGGDREAFRLLLQKYSTTEDALKQCAILELKAELLYSYLYGSGGEAMTTGEKEDYFKAHYKRVKILYLNTLTNEKVVFKDNGGTETVALNAMEIWENQRIDGELSLLLGEGSELTEAEFDTYLQKSNELLHAVYEDGIYLYDQAEADGNFTAMIGGEAIETAAKALKVGELRRLSTEKGVAYIFGYALDYAPYLDDANDDFFTDFLPDAAGAALNARVSAEIGNVTLHTEVLAECRSIIDLPYNPDEIRRYTLD